MSHALPSHSPRLTVLDALRGVLGLIVAIGHAAWIFATPAVGQPSLRDPLTLILGFWFLLARGAVLAFFCLSGFAIARSIHQNRLRHGQISVGDYTLSRWIRLLPPLLMTISLAWLGATVNDLLGWRDLPPGLRLDSRGAHTHPLEQLLAIATLCSAGDLTGGMNRSLATLAFEIQLYTFVGLGALALPRQNPPLRRALGWLLLAAYGGLLVVRDMESRVSLDDISAQVVSFAAFSIGWLSFHYVAGLRARTVARIAQASMLAGVTLLALALLGVDSAVSVDSRPTVVLAQIAFLTAGTALFVRYAGSRASPYLTRLGRYSLTLYVIHLPVYVCGAVALHHILPHHGHVVGFAIALVAVLTVLLLANCLSHIVERPRSKRRWLARTFPQFVLWISGPAAVQAPPAEAASTTDPERFGHHA